ncbi:MAG: RNA 2',3'-cyclic phosphodiesterase [Candidatus Binatia bacterium]
MGRQGGESGRAGRPAALRAFVAVELPPTSHARLVALKRELAEIEPAVRWTRDEGLHATIKFLGSTAAETVDALRAALTAPIARVPPPAVRLRGLGAFPHVHRPHVLWAGIDCPALGELAARVDAAAAGLGFASETRPFHAHVTLARLDGARFGAALDASLRAHWEDDFGGGALRELVAFRSDLRPGGALYTKLWTIPFGG